jgi:hypothetical protein
MKQTTHKQDAKRVRCSACRYFAFQRYCNLGDITIRDAGRPRRCSAWASNVVDRFEDGLRLLFDMRQCLAAAVVDGQLLKVLAVWAMGGAGILSTPYRLYLILPDRVSVVDADRPYGWIPVYGPLAEKMHVAPVAAYWASPGE